MKFLLLLIAALAGVALADPFSDLAKKQRAAIYDAAEEGLRDYEITVSSPAWPGAKVHFRWSDWDVRIEGAAEEQAGEAIRAEFGDLMRVLPALARRIDPIPEGFTTEVKPEEEGFLVVARKPEGAKDEYPLSITTLLGKDLLTRSIEEEYPGSAIRAFRDFTWDRQGAKSLASAFTLFEEHQETRVLVEHDSVGGFALPGRVRLIRDSVERAFLFTYRSVNGQPVAAAGPFGTPEATVRSFFAAAAQGDEGMLRKCFSPNAPEEFQSLVQGTTSPEDLQGLGKMFAASRVLGVTMGKDGKTARVKVTCRRGEKEKEEELSMVLDEENEWRILDF